MREPLAGMENHERESSCSTARNKRGVVMYLYVNGKELDGTVKSPDHMHPPTELSGKALESSWLPSSSTLPVTYTLLPGTME